MRMFIYGATMEQFKGAAIHLLPSNAHGVLNPTTVTCYPTST